MSKILKVGTSFSGIGAPEQALKNLKIPHVVEWACDFDKKAKETYLANHSCKSFDDDITKIDISTLKEVDLYVFGFPCFIGSEFVLTETGYKRISDISLRDSVLTHNNNFKKVKNIFKNGHKDIWTIKGTGLLEISSTEEHPFLVRERKGNKYLKPRWEKLKNITPKKDYVGFAINKKKDIPNYQGSLCSTAHDVRNKKTLDMNSLDFWWFIGRYLADGWYVNYQRKKRKNSFCKKVILCCGHSEINDILPFLKKTNLHFTQSKEADTYKFHFSNQELVNYVEQFGRYCHGKKLTQDIFDLPIPHLKSFLDGYISGDGYISENDEIKVSSISKELILGIQTCIHKVYKRPTRIYLSKKRDNVSICGRKVNTSDIFSIAFKKEGRTLGFYENGYIWQPVQSVSKTERIEEVFNIEVEGDNSYTINNCIVHNCQSVSHAGNRDLSDGRTTLVSYSLDTIDKLKPKYIIFENVRGLLNIKFKDFFDSILARLNVLYNIQYTILNSKNLGVPQNRERVFCVGIRKDIKSDFDFQKIKNIRIETKLKDFLDDNVDEYYYKLCPSILKAIHKTKRLKVLDKNKYCYTITTQQCRCFNNSGMIDDDGRLRFITPNECRKLQGFPDSWIMPESKHVAYKQFGNSITVNVLEEIFKELLKDYLP